MENALTALCILLFESSDSVSIVLMAVYLAGLWRILEKSGLKGWWALIPGARDYQLARCAGRETEGRVYSLSGAGLIVLTLILHITGVPQDLETSSEFPSGFLIATIAVLMLSIVRFIYTIRIWSGLIDM